VKGKSVEKRGERGKKTSPEQRCPKESAKKDRGPRSREKDCGKTTGHRRSDRPKSGGGKKVPEKRRPQGGDPYLGAVSPRTHFPLERLGSLEQNLKKGTRSPEVGHLNSSGCELLPMERAPAGQSHRRKCYRKKRGERESPCNPYSKEGKVKNIIRSPARSQVEGDRQSQSQSKFFRKGGAPY